MFLIAGLAIPPEMTQFFRTLQGFFPSKTWRPAPTLALPLVTLGQVVSPTAMEELDHGLLALRLRQPIRLRHTGFTLVERQRRILLAALVQGAETDHLSVKIRAAARRAGLTPPPPHTPLAVLLADVATAPVEEVNHWLSIHYATCPDQEELYEFTVFSSGKNHDPLSLKKEADYPFTNCFRPDPELL
ncbi:MAG: hypothetical protein ABF785_11475 [Acetobacter papayae]|uniref:hypothetical protein n=1 Tax=Acetobacter papayae TaxID=1076592 RepID=UPI0039EC731A